MSRKIYIAGPDVFAPNAVEIGEKYKAICKKYGFKGLYPLDADEASTRANDKSSADEASATKAPTSRQIFLSNLKKIKKADYIVANLNDFRGYGMDDGTAWEIGHAYTLGKTIVGYMDNTSDMRTRWEREEISNYTVEDFGLPVNLMIAEATHKIVRGDFEDAVEFLAETEDKVAKMKAKKAKAKSHKTKKAKAKSH